MHFETQPNQKKSVHPEPEVQPQLIIPDKGKSDISPEIENIPDIDSFLDKQGELDKKRDEKPELSN